MLALVGTLCGGSLAAAAASGWPDLQTPLRTPDRAPHDAAVVIGIEAYASLPPVPYARRDADAFYQWLLFAHGVRPEAIARLLDSSQPAVEAALTKAARQVDPDGTLWVYFAGHGVASPDDAHHYLLTRDGTVERPSLSIEDLQAWAEQTTAGHVIFVVDAAFGGVGRDGRPIDRDRRFLADAPAVPADNRVVTWLAAGPRDLASALDVARQGLFTYHVVGALRGWADGVFGTRDGVVTLEEAQTWVHDAVIATGRDQSTSVDPRAEPRAWVVAPARQATPELTGLDLGRAPPWDAQLQGTLAPGDHDLTRDGFVMAFDEHREDDGARGSDRTRFKTPAGLHRPGEPGWEPRDADFTDAEWLAWAEGELRTQLQTQADAEWSSTYAQAITGTPAGLEALQRFIGRYNARSYFLADTEVVITASQIPEARRLLTHGGRPTRSLVDTVHLDAGTFTMGSPAGSAGRGPDETLRRVTLTRGLEVGVVEVHQRLWTTVMGYNPSAHEGGDLPVESISWLEAVVFCNALSELEGLDPAYAIDGKQVTWDPDADGFRLPTEAEWEHLAGPKTFPGADDVRDACRLGNVRDAHPPGLPGSDPGLGTFSCDDGFAGTAPVRALPAGAHGIRGLVGNVAEWTWDAWTSPTAAAQIDPAPDRPTRSRVAKGGSFTSSPAEVRTAARQAVIASTKRDDLGLRVVRNTPR